MPLQGLYITKFGKIISFGVPYPTPAPMEMKYGTHDSTPKSPMSNLNTTVYALHVGNYTQRA